MDETRVLEILSDRRLSGLPHLPGLALLMKEERSAPGEEDGGTPKDQSITPAHLLDGCLHDLAHTLAHLDRLNDAEVQKDPAAVAFNASHAMHHALGTQDHAVRVADFLSEHASDPAEFKAQLKQLQAARRHSIKNNKPEAGPGETEKSQPRYYLGPPRA